jgi:hypothetical protein
MENEMLDCVGKKENEVFVGNHETSQDLSHLASLHYRLGDIALDLNDKKLPENYKPLFILKEEAEKYDKIMMDRFHKI